MMQSDIVFTLVIGQIFLSCVPSEVINLLWNLVTYPEKSHFHWSWSLSLHCIVCYSNCCCIIPMYWRLWLWMAKVCQCLSKYHTCLKIMEECSEFCHCRCRHDKSHDCCIGVKCSIEFDWLAILWHPSHEEVSTRSAVRLFFDRYDASECMFIIISDSWNLTFASALLSR